MNENLDLTKILDGCPYLGAENSDLDLPDIS